MNCRHIICIPVYNNEKTIIDVIGDCLKKTTLPLLVVDDGSTIPVQKLFDESVFSREPTTRDRVTFLRHPKNIGKGMALRTAFESALKRGYTHVVAIDGDGQHFASDIEHLLQESNLHPWALIVGDRNMQTDNVPGSSLFGRSFSNFWVRYQTNTVVADSQSGFRIYPLFHLQTMHFFCRRYDFEIEVLIRLLWRGVDVRNVKIQVKYLPPGERVSHFHKGKDNFRITCVNVVLVSLSLLRSPISPWRAGLAFGLGVLVGCTPFFGLHTFIVAAMALTFRLNFVYLFVGTQISLPPFIPFIIMGSQYIGDLVLQDGPKGVFTFTREWFVGSFIFGAQLGLVAGAAVFVLQRKTQRRPTGDQAVSKRVWSGHEGPKHGIRFLKLILDTFGPWPVYGIMYFVVPYYFLFFFKTRQACHEYWGLMRPDLGYWGRQVKIFQQLMVFAKTLIDRAYQKDSATDKFTVLADERSRHLMKHIENDSTRGSLIVSSHMGGWEVVMFFFQTLGLNKKMLAIAFGGVQNYHRTSGEAVAHPDLKMVEFNRQQNTILAVRDHLNAGHTVGIMADRPVSQKFELVPFLGRLAPFDSTAFRVALACKAHLYFVFCFKENAGTYRVFMEYLDVQKLESIDKEAQVAELLKFYTGMLEKYLNRYPEQWFNFFRFWSQSPVAEGRP